MSRIERAQLIRRTYGVLAVVLAIATTTLSAEPAASPAPAPTGTWRGTSTCTDLVAAPACKNEVVVYEFSKGERPGSVLWKADKVVDGQRQPMGEMDLAYDAEAGCWKAQFLGRNATTVWCLTMNGTHITGTGKQLPGNERIRQIEVDRDEAAH